MAESLFTQTQTTTMTTTLLQSGGSYEEAIDEANERLVGTVRNAKGNAVTALKDGLTSYAEEIKQTLQQSDEFIVDVQDMSEKVDSKKDKEILARALEVATNQKKLVRETMDVCRIIGEDVSSWQHFYRNIRLAYRKIQQQKEDFGKRILQKVVSKIPRVEGIITTLQELYVKWDEHVDDIEEMHAHFSSLAEKYDKKAKQATKTKKWSRTVMIGCGIAGAVGLAALIAVCVIALPVAGPAGALAIGTAVALEGGAVAGGSLAVAGIAAGGVSLAAGCAGKYFHSKKNKNSKLAKHMLGLKEQSTKIKQKTQNASENVERIKFLSKDIQIIIETHIRPSKTLDLGTAGDDNFECTVEELYFALEMMYESEQEYGTGRIDEKSSGFEDTCAESIKAAKEVEQKVGELRRYLAEINSSDSKAKKARAAVRAAMNES